MRYACFFTYSPGLITGWVILWGVESITWRGGWEYYMKGWGVLLEDWVLFVTRGWVALRWDLWVRGVRLSVCLSLPYVRVLSVKSDAESTPSCWSDWVMNVFLPFFNSFIATSSAWCLRLGLFFSHLFRALKVTHASCMSKHSKAEKVGSKDRECNKTLI